MLFSLSYSHGLQESVAVMALDLSYNGMGKPFYCHAPVKDAVHDEHTQ